MEFHTFIVDSIDHIKIVGQYTKLKDHIQWETVPGKSRQTGIQFIEGEDPFLSAVGKKKEGVNEQEYETINPLFLGTVFETIVKKYNLYRTRLMWMEPYACYSIHQDTTHRVHIPLFTNPKCYFIWPDDQKMEFLAAGKVYVVDTTRPHSFVNFSNLPRLHLVGCVEN